LHGGQGDEILLPRFAPQLDQLQQVVFGIGVLPEGLLTLGQNREAMAIVIDKSGLQMGQRLGMAFVAHQGFAEKPAGFGVC
jgi:hypothetical protein